MNDFRLADSAMSDGEAREARANLTEFFSILLEWDAAQSPSASAIVEELPTTTKEGRSTQT